MSESREFTPADWKAPRTIGCVHWLIALSFTALISLLAILAVRQSMSGESPFIPLPGFPRPSPDWLRVYGLVGLGVLAIALYSIWDWAITQS